MDSLGRFERCHLAPGTLVEGDELRISHALAEAGANARRATENLDVDGTDEPAGPGPDRQDTGQRPGSRRGGSRDEDDGWDPGGSILRAAF